MSLTASPTLRLVGKRLLAAIPVIWGVTLVAFVVVTVLPGDAAEALLGPNATEGQVADLRARLGLDEPFVERYATWLSNVGTGDLGRSYASDQSVLSILGERLPVTLELLAFAFAFSLALTIPVALLAARKPGGIADRISMFVSMTGLSIANYILALLLVFVFAVQLQVLPAIGFVEPSESIWGNIESLILPAVSIGFPLFCFYTRLLRADILEQMQGEDYVITAKAKGLSPWRVLVRHALPNSLFGLLTIVALNVGTLIGAGVIVEQIFSIPGIAGTLLAAINNRDVFVIQAIVLVLAIVTVLANLIADILYSVLDPRIRYERATD